MSQLAAFAATSASGKKITFGARQAKRALSPITVLERSLPAKRPRIDDEGDDEGDQEMEERPTVVHKDNTHRLKTRTEVWNVKHLRQMCCRKDLIKDDELRAKLRTLLAKHLASSARAGELTMKVRIKYKFGLMVPGLSRVYAAGKSLQNLSMWAHEECVKDKNGKEVKAWRPAQCPLLVADPQSKGDASCPLITELDVGNCLPTIADARVRMAGVSKPRLRRYVEHRAECVALIQAAVNFHPWEPEPESLDLTEGKTKRPPHDPKTMVVAILNGLGDWTEKVLSHTDGSPGHQFLTELQTEAKDLWKCFSKDDFPILHERFRPTVVPNMQRKFTAHCLQELETAAMDVAEEVCASQGIAVRCRKHDAVLLDFQGHDTLRLQVDIQNSIEDRMGLALTFKNKTAEYVPSKAALALVKPLDTKDFTKEQIEAHQAEFIELKRETQTMKALGKSLRLWPATKVAPMVEQLAARETHAATAAASAREDLAAMAWGHEHKFCAKSAAWFVADRGVWSRASVKDGSDPMLKRLVDGELDMLRMVAADTCKELAHELGMHLDHWASEPSKTATGFSQKIVANMAHNEMCLVPDLVAELDDFDRTGHLLPFTNGYVDLKELRQTKKVVLRPHVPENYVSLTTGYDFDQGDPDVEATAFVEKFFEQVLPEEAVREFLLDNAADSFQAGNCMEWLLCLIGRSRAGKSKVVSLVQSVFGDLAGNLKSAVVDRNRATAHDSELVAVVKKRLVFMAESGNQKVDLDVEKLNEISGNDRLALRECHGKAVEQKPSIMHFTLVAVMNDPFPTQAGTEAVSAFYERTKYASFNQRFVANPDPENPKESQADPELKTRLDLPEVRHAFLHLLLKRYANLRDRQERLAAVPEEVRAKTSSIKSAADVEQQAIDELFVRHRTKYTYDEGWEYEDRSAALVKDAAKGTPLRVCAATAAAKIVQVIERETDKRVTNQEAKRILARKFGDDYRPKHYVTSGSDRKREASLLGWIWAEGVMEQVFLGKTDNQEHFYVDLTPFLNVN